ncbi:hypothetical protein ACHAWF_003207 [Thalassiosira exigua]
MNARRSRNRRLLRGRKGVAPPFLLLFILMLLRLRTTPVAASGILTDLVTSTYQRLFPPEDYIDDDFETKTLDIVEIAEMRARDIKRRLARAHGYEPDELAKMIDKKDLINTLSFEEHKAHQIEADRIKWIRFKTTVIYTCAAIAVVMFWPLLRHAVEVAHVNFVVYTDRRKYEIKRCRDFHSLKGYFGIFFLFIIDVLSFWLSASVLLSWVMRSKWFFPTPNIPIRPAQLLTPQGGDAGALGKYGINVGPMIITWCFRFLNGQVEAMIGRAMAEALDREKRREKEERKRVRREERAMEKEARREARRQARKAKEERAADGDGDENDESSDGENSYSGMTASNVTRNNMHIGGNTYPEPSAPSSNLNDLD